MGVIHYTFYNVSQPLSCHNITCIHIISYMVILVFPYYNYYMQYILFHVVVDLGDMSSTMSLDVPEFVKKLKEMSKKTRGDDTFVQDWVDWVAVFNDNPDYLTQASWNDPGVWSKARKHTLSRMVGHETDLLVQGCVANIERGTESGDVNDLLEKLAVCDTIPKMCVVLCDFVAKIEGGSWEESDVCFDFSQSHILKAVEGYIKGASDCIRDISEFNIPSLSLPLKILHKKKKVSFAAKLNSSIPVSVVSSQKESKVIVINRRPSPFRDGNAAFKPSLKISLPTKRPKDMNDCDDVPLRPTKGPYLCLETKDDSTDVTSVETKDADSNVIGEDEGEDVVTDDVKDVRLDDVDYDGLGDIDSDESKDVRLDNVDYDGLGNDGDDEGDDSREVMGEDGIAEYYRGQDVKITFENDFPPLTHEKTTTVEPVSTQKEFKSTSTTDKTSIWKKGTRGTVPICPFFKTTCKLGSGCAFAHVSTTVDCVFFTRGNCFFGNKCRNRHTVTPTPVVKKVSILRRPVPPSDLPTDGSLVAEKMVDVGVNTDNPDDDYGFGSEYSAYM